MSPCGDMPACEKGKCSFNKYFHCPIVNGSIMKGLYDDPGDNWEIWDICSLPDRLMLCLSQALDLFLVRLLSHGTKRIIYPNNFIKPFHHEKSQRLKFLNTAAFTLFKWNVLIRSNCEVVLIGNQALHWYWCAWLNKVTEVTSRLCKIYACDQLPMKVNQFNFSDW